MEKLKGLKPEKVFEYFEKLSSIPRGSGNREGISRFCEEFAKEHSLKFIRDDENNVIIYKEGTKGYENSEPVILQGHLDMVCQKEEGIDIDFEKDGLELYTDGDFVKAKGTTLGGDNGIAVAMALTILDSDDIPHPPLEVVFTVDEEIGMLGAMKLDMSHLNGRKMINIDSEEQDVITVSCAGGSDFYVKIPIARKKVSSKGIKLTLKGLKGGHSGVEINSKRVNANVLMARVLDHIKELEGFSLVSISGGDKGNAIPLSSVAEFVISDSEKAICELNSYIQIIQEEISFREPDFKAEIVSLDTEVRETIDQELSKKLIYLLLCAPNGVTEMSAEIENLVESSLNLGILKTDADCVSLLYTLRSNKKSGLKFLEDKLKTFYQYTECEIEASGHYPPWEFKSDSVLRTVYKEVFSKKMGYEPKVEAIHAGLECGVFASALDGLDCISVGPQMYDIHTTKERLSITSTQNVFEIICEVLGRI